MPSPESGRLTVPLARAETAVDALVALRQSGIDVAELNMAKPSLDEVFLTLTGHDTSEQVPTTSEDGESR